MGRVLTYRDYLMLEKPDTLWLKEREYLKRYRVDWFSLYSAERLAIRVLLLAFNRFILVHLLRQMYLDVKSCLSKYNRRCDMEAAI